QLDQTTAKYADTDSHRRLATTDQWRRAHANIIVARSENNGRDCRVSLPRGLPIDSRAYLSRPSARLTDAAQGPGTNGASAPCRHSHRNRGHNRFNGAGLVPEPFPPVHYELHDTVSRIHCGALAGAERTGLRSVTPLPCGCDRDHGGDAVADG